MSKHCPKLDIFFKKIAKNCHFFQQNCQKLTFFSIFLKKMSRFWPFFDSQMAIFRRVISETRLTLGLPPVMPTTSMVSMRSLRFVGVASVSPEVSRSSMEGGGIGFFGVTGVPDFGRKQN